MYNVGILWCGPITYVHLIRKCVQYSRYLYIPVYTELYYSTLYTGIYNTYHTATYKNLAMSCVYVSTYRLHNALFYISHFVPKSTMTTTTEKGYENKRLKGEPEHATSDQRAILLAITGSVAAVKGPEIAVRLAVGVQADVTILLTRGGQNFWDKAEAYNKMHWDLMQSLIKNKDGDGKGKISIVRKFFSQKAPYIPANKA